MLSKWTQHTLLVGLLIGFMANLGGAPLAHAVMVEQDAHHVYHIVPYKQYLSDNDNLKKIMLATLMSLQNYVEETRSAQEQAQADAATAKAEIEETASSNPIQMTIDDLVAQQYEQQETETALAAINVFIEDSKNFMRLRGWKDIIPSAFMVFLGGMPKHKINPHAKGTATAAFVVLPVKVRRIAKDTGVMDEYITVRINTSFFMHGDLGMSAGAGQPAKPAKLRVGVGLIWGSDHFNDPAQFVGFNFAGSMGTRLFGKGGNVKLGTVMNWGLPGIMDFVYLSLGLDLKTLFSGGKSAQLAQQGARFEVHTNAGLVFDGETLLDIFGRATSSSDKSVRRAMEQHLSTWIRESSGISAPPVRKRPPAKKPPAKKPPSKKPAPKPKPDPDLDGNKTSPGRPLQ